MLEIQPGWDESELGFTKFVQTRNNVPMDVNGLKVMITSLVAPADGPLGDAGH